MGDDKAGNAALSEHLLGREVDPAHQILIDEPGHVETGEKQAPACRDLWCAILYVAHQIVLFCFAIAGFRSLNFTYYDSYNSLETIHFAGLLYLALISSFFGLVIAAASLSVLVRIAAQLVQISLVVSIVSTAGLAVFFLMEKYWSSAGIFFLLFVWGVCYAKAVWRRIPFAASNLKIALHATQTNGGIFVFSGIVTVAMILWNLIWTLAVLGVYAHSTRCENGICENHVRGMVVVAFLLSYYWTAEVSKNILHVTVSGVVSTWYFSPDEAAQFYSQAVADSLLRATTYSLGSICLGSLLTAILQVVYHLLTSARREHRGNAMLLCVLECIVGFLERIVTYFNKWSYTYIAIYGYDYLTAGQKVMNLLRQKGWTAIINDDLIVRVLGLLSLVIGGITGCLGMALANLKPTWVEEFGTSSTAISFLVPFLIGTSVSYILLSVVASAVDTIIVCFAEAPIDLERHHPVFYAQLVQAWRLVYPGEI